MFQTWTHIYKDSIRACPLEREGTRDGKESARCQRMKDDFV